MDGLPYLAAVAGSAVSVLVIRCMCHRFDVAGRRGLQALFAAVGSVAGIFTYYLLVPIFVLIHPGRGREIGIAIRDGTQISGAIIIAATTLCLRYYTRANAPPSTKPNANVREQLLKARQTIQWRIEGLQSSPQHDYRGGVPQTDTIINELTEKLREIDKALAELGP